MFSDAEKLARDGRYATKKSEILRLISQKLQSIESGFVSTANRPLSVKSDPRYMFLADLETKIKSDDMKSAMAKVESGKRQPIALFLTEIFSAVGELNTIWASVLK
jgi:hypothetical protein